MQVWTTLTEDEQREIGRELGIELYELREHGQRVRRYQYTLRPATERYRSWDPMSGRRIWAVCWHGHRDYMRAVYELDPSARFKSAMADYRGADDFESKFPDTAYTNVGSQMFPVLAREKCEGNHYAESPY